MSFLQKLRYLVVIHHYYVFMPVYKREFLHQTQTIHLVSGQACTFKAT